MSAPAAAPTAFVCGSCGAESPAEPAFWSCPVCGGPLDLPPPDLRGDVVLSGQGVWRYVRWVPVRTRVSLGEPTTPLVELPYAGRDVTFKVEGALPTGSFKDRGAAVLVSWLAEHGVERALDDSSGNAGAALAAYCARAGIACDIYAPADTSPAKLAQIEVYGARVVRVPGSRRDTTDAAVAAAADGVVYATHSGPVYVAGTQTFAFELWEQLARDAPDVLVLPVSGGSLLLGAYRGFTALHAAGLVSHVPRIVGVQAAACAPLARAFATGLPDPVEVEPQRSAAQGLMQAAPLRGRQVLAAVAATSGTMVAVTEDDILAARTTLARSGVFVEPTSAVAVAALEQLAAEPDERIVVGLTGHGLKSPA